jgi:biopolymer transport protein ExbD
MKSRGKRRSDGGPQLEMTPMIDVVFQLLIFFIVTLRQDDILSRLTAARPQAADTRVPSIPLIEIVLHRGGFFFRGQPVTAATLDRQLGRYAELSTTASVVVKCTTDSPHQLLVQALDLCSKHQMRNLSVLSM